MALTLSINGQNRVFEGVASPSSLLEVMQEMELRADRVAVEHNGEIAPRARWSDIRISSGDRLEVVHFVGGGMKSVNLCTERVGKPGSGHSLPITGSGGD